MPIKYNTKKEELIEISNKINKLTNLRNELFIYQNKKPFVKI